VTVLVQIIPPIDLRIGGAELDTSIRLLILLSVLRQAIGIPQVPPNQVIIALSLFLTFFIMRPVIEDINTNALQPYLNGQISDTVFFERVSSAIKEFMGKNTRKDTLKVFMDSANLDKEKRDECSNTRLHGKRDNNRLSDSFSSLPSLSYN